MAGVALRLGVLAFAVFAAGAGATPAAAPPASPAQPAATPAIGDIQKIDDLQALFDADKGRYRIVVLLSPT